MKKFKYNDLKENELFALILKSHYKDIHNSFGKEYEKNFIQKDFFEDISLILNQVYLLKNKNTQIIEFKGDFLQRKKEAEIGTVEFNLKDQKRIYKYYEGKFVYYVIMMNTLFYRFFHQEIEDKDKNIFRLAEFLRENYREIRENPTNSLLVEKVLKPFEESSLTVSDMADYMNLLMHELKSHYDSEEDGSIDINLEIDNEDLETTGTKIMFMKETGIIDFLIDKYDLTDKPSHLSKIICEFTGFKHTTVNGIINPIYNSSNNQKNNPYKSQDNVLKVEAKIHRLGLTK
jgi:hypothetical protein